MSRLYLVISSLESERFLKDITDPHVCHPKRSKFNPERRLEVARIRQRASCNLCKAMRKSCVRLPLTNIEPFTLPEINEVFY